MLYNYKMETNKRLCLDLMVILVVLGNVNSIHRNTVDITRPSRRVFTNGAQINPSEPGSSIHTSGSTRQLNAITRNQEPHSINVVGNGGNRHAQSNFRSAHNSPQDDAHVDLPGQHGNRSPFPVVHRERHAHPPHESQSQSRRESSIDSNNEPVGEPPVLFLNRERIRRRNRMRTQNTHRQRAPPPDVQPMPFEGQNIPFQGHQFPFQEIRMNGIWPHSIQDRRLLLNNELQNDRQSYNQPQMFQQRNSPPMASFPGSSGYMRSEHPDSLQINRMMPRQQNYMDMMRSADNLLEALPIPMRRMLRRRRRMRRIERFRNFHPNNDQYFRGPFFP